MGGKCDRQRNGASMAGATGAVLQATGPAGGVEEYRCVVSNAIGVGTSGACRVAQPVQILSQMLPGGMEMSPYHAELMATNGFPPYTWIISHEMPPGLSSSGDGVISGLPTLAGTYLITFIIRDSAGHSAEKEMGIVIAPNPNRRPVLVYSTPSAGAFTMNGGTSQTFRAMAYDPEWDELRNVWANLSGLIVATDYRTAFTSQIPEGTTHQFYRLIVLTP